MNNQTIVFCVVALLLGMLSFHMLKGACGCKDVEGQGQQISSDMCASMLDQFKDSPQNKHTPAFSYGLINSVDPFQFGAQGVTITPIFNPNGIRTPGDNIGCELNSKIFIPNADENHPWMKNVCSNYCGVDMPAGDDPAPRAICFNAVETVPASEGGQPEGSCDRYAAANQCHLFQTGADYAGYCDLSCGICGN